MAKRRTVVLGMGAMAMGSGAALSQAALGDSVAPGADFRIIAAGDLRVRRGAAFEEPEEAYVVESSIGFETLDASNLPMAFANEEENGALSIELARRNSSDSFTFTDLVEIENVGSTTESVGINFDDGTTDGYFPDGTESWFTADYTEDSEQITKRDIQEIFRFVVRQEELDALDQTAHSGDEQISPDPASGGDEDPDFFVELGPAESIQIDLVTTLDGDQVSIFAGEANVGDPFDGSHDDFQLLESVNVGIEST